MKKHMDTDKIILAGEQETEERQKPLFWMLLFH